VALTPTSGRVGVWAFVRLKLRITGNSLRGRPARIVMFVLGLVAACFFAILGHTVFALPGLLDKPGAAEIMFPFGGTVLILGWVFLPLLFFGVDNTLDPAQFALLPLRRRTLITGMGAAALAGLPALATFAATLGMVTSAAQLGGLGAALAGLAGVVLGLLFCVALSRAVISAFATALRSRRARDLATIMLAVVAASIGPLELTLLGVLNRADWDSVEAIAQVTGWTPFGAPYTMGLDVAAGRAWAVPLKILIVLAAVGGLLWWWSRTLEQAMVGAASSGGRSRAGVSDNRGPVRQLLFRWSPRSRFGALTAREVRYWWRETRRRAALVTLGMAGVFLPLTTAFAVGDSGGSATGLAFFVGAIAPITLANQFGYEGSAYATNLATGVPGHLEVHSRAAAHALFTVPLLLLVAVVTGLVDGRPADIAAQLGTLLATYGAGLALVLPISVRAAYSLPDTTGPFSLSSGGGFSKTLPGLAALIGALIAGVPVLVLTQFWPWLGLPVGLVYGVGAYLLGAHLAGAWLDRRMPELLAAVTPR
jgi:ABC-2 type transport system permease protein